MAWTWSALVPVFTTLDVAWYYQARLCCINNSLLQIVPIVFGWRILKGVRVYFKIQSQIRSTTNALIFRTQYKGRRLLEAKNSMEFEYQYTSFEFILPFWLFGLAELSSVLNMFFSKAIFSRSTRPHSRFLPNSVIIWWWFCDWIFCWSIWLHLSERASVFLHSHSCTVSVLRLSRKCDHSAPHWCL